MDKPPPVNPILFFEALNGYQKTAAVRAGIELEIFSHIAAGATTADAIAAKAKASVRGVRILCDYLVVHGFLTKSADAYGLSPASATFLVRSSPAYLGGAAEFLLSSTIMEAFDNLTEAVRSGRTTLPENGTTKPEHDVWVRFARAMSPVMAMAADELARLVLAGSKEPMQVLDVAASHGVFGLAFARQNPNAIVTGLDWANVLEMAKENAAKMGFADRYRTIAGSAFDVPLTEKYDVILLPNFLHHFDLATNQTLMTRFKPALKPGGKVVVSDFVPNDDRVTPPAAAAFALTMLATTPAGDAFTFAEYDRTFRAAGFGRSVLHRTPDGMHSCIVTTL